MEYKSTRSEKFVLWLRRSSLSDVEKRLIGLEKAARILVHHYDLTGDFDVAEMHLLARAVKQLQADYEHKE